jgi:hypothetical protein
LFSFRGYICHGRKGLVEQSSLHHGGQEAGRRKTQEGQDIPPKDIHPQKRF